MSHATDDEPGDETGHEDPLLVEWVAEMADRLRGGESVDWEQLASQYPDRAAALRDLLPAFDLMSGLGKAARMEPTAREPLPEPLKELGCLGDFRLFREVGRGGMGVVYEARQLSLGRRVALKILPQSLALDGKRLHRFQLEAQAAALLYHPHIVPVHAVGTDRGVHYYAMQFIDGRTLADLIRELRRSENIEPDPAGDDLLSSHLATQLLSHDPTTATATGIVDGPEPEPTSRRSARGAAYFQNTARMGRQVAEALQHAHQHGVLHRDVKPGNLMIDRDGHVWITDFGLARLMDDPGLTMTNDLLGTIRYMSPEQVMGRPAIVDQRADVYSLGVTLYELLSLQPVFRGRDRAEVLRQILEQEPTPLRRLDGKIPLDLETIVHKAIDKDPARRYASAGAMGEDLRRYLEHLPILARRPTVLDHSIKWSRRHWSLVAVAAGFLLLAVAGLVADLTWSNRWLQRHNDRLGEALAQADANAREAERQRGIAEAQLELAQRHQHAENLRRASQALESRQLDLAQEILHDDEPEPGMVDQRGFAWRYLWEKSRREVCLDWGHQGTVRGVLFAPDGLSLAIFDHPGKFVLSRLANGVIADQIRAKISTRYAESNTAMFSANGRYLATGVTQHGGVSEGFEVFDCQTGLSVLHRPLPSETIIWSMAFHEAARQFVALTKAAGQYSIESFNLAEISASPKQLALPTGLSLAILSPDAQTLCLQNAEGIALADPLTGQITRRLSGPESRADPYGNFSPDSRFINLMVGAEMLVWETEAGRLVARQSIPGPLSGFGWSPRGRYLCWGEDNGRVAILETTTANVRELVPRSSDYKVLGLDASFSSDEMLFTYNQRRIPGGYTPTRVWNVQSGQVTARFPQGLDPKGAHFIPGGHDVLLIGAARLGVWKFESPKEPDRLAGHRAEAWTVAFSPDSKILATGSDDTAEPQTIRLWDSLAGQQLAGWKGHASMVSAVAFSPDGRTLASASFDSRHPNIILWDALTRKPQADLPGHEAAVRTIAFSPDGQRLASAGNDCRVRIWDLAARIVRATLAGHTGKINSLAFSPDGKLLVSTSNDATLRLWDVSTGQPRGVLEDVREVFSARFAPDGSILASVNELGELKLWNPAEGRLLRTIPGDSAELRTLDFTPDSQAIAAAGKSKVIHIWDVVTGQEILTLEGHAAQINALAFSPDGSLLASCSHDGAVRLWRAAASKSKAGLSGPTTR